MPALLDRPRTVQPPARVTAPAPGISDRDLGDLLELGWLEQQKWTDGLERITASGEPTNARNTWAQLLDLDPRGGSADGLTLASFTTSAPVFPKVTFPANYFRTGRLLHLRARGIWAATGTPTYTFRLQNITGTTVTLATSAAITVSALTNQAWEIDLQIQCRTEGTGGTLLAMGDLNLGGVTGTQYLPATGSAPAAVTVDTTILQEWQLEIACSASNAANTVKGIILELKSLN